jgi:hypothetical protein
MHVDRSRGDIAVAKVVPDDGQRYTTGDRVATVSMAQPVRAGVGQSFGRDGIGGIQLIGYLPEKALEDLIQPGSTHRCYRLSAKFANKGRIPCGVTDPTELFRSRR